MVYLALHIPPLRQPAGIPSGYYEGYRQDVPLKRFLGYAQQNGDILSIPCLLAH